MITANTVENLNYECLFDEKTRIATAIFRIPGLKRSSIQLAFALEVSPGVKEPHLFLRVIAKRLDGSSPSIIVYKPTGLNGWDFNWTRYNQVYAEYVNGCLTFKFPVKRHDQKLFTVQCFSAYEHLDDVPDANIAFPGVEMFS